MKKLICYIFLGLFCFIQFYALEFSENRQELFWLIESEDVDSIKKMIDSKEEINIIDKITGLNPFQVSLTRTPSPNFELASLFLENGIKPDLKSLKKLYPDYFEEYKEGLICEFKVAINYHKAKKSYENSSVLNFDVMPIVGFAAMNGNERLLEGLIENEFDIEEKDSCGNTPLILSVMNRKFNTAKILLENGADIYKTNDLGLDAFFYAEMLPNRNIADLIMDFNKDSLMELVVKKRRGESVENFRINYNEDEFYIGISMVENYYYYGNEVYNIARHLMRENPNIHFRLITIDMLSDEFIRQFNGIINPGSPDTFPKLGEFQLKDLDRKKMLAIELMYQKATELAGKNKIPLFGICGGHQHMSLWRGGTLKRVKNHFGGKYHKVNFIKGTLPYFMALTEKEQAAALEDCELPGVSFEVNSYHNYAIVNDKLGSGFKLGALSKEGVVEAIFDNGHFTGMQFHLESDYLEYEGKVNRNQLIFDYFIKMCKMHNKYLTQTEKSDLAMQKLKIEIRKILDRMQECLETCNKNKVYSEPIRTGF